MSFEKRLLSFALFIRPSFAALLLAAQSLGCSGTAEDGTEFASSSQPLGRADAVLGFEVATDWTSSAGIVESTSVRTQGEAALSLREFASAELVSPPVSSLSGVTDRLGLSIRPPVSPNSGEIQIRVSSARLGLDNATVGRASLRGLPAGTFSEIVISIPSAIRRALRTGYEDLRIKLSLNVPRTSAAYVLDRLRFVGVAQPCGTGSPYTLQVFGADGLDPAVTEEMRCTFFDVYPKLATRFNPNAPGTVQMYFEEDGSAWAWGTETHYGKRGLIENPVGTDVAVHELMHVIQSGHTDNNPSWLDEGAADFVRDQYGRHNIEAGWTIPSAYVYGQHYLFGYGDAASFFKWVDATYRVGTTPVLDSLDAQERQNGYNDGIWVQLTGKSLQALWLQYSGNQAPLPATSGITVYDGPNFEGRSVMLDRGTYDLVDLTARAVGNDWISSLRVPAGYTVLAYSDHHFGGSSREITVDTSQLEDWNDQISSLVIE